MQSKTNKLNNFKILIFKIISLLNHKIKNWLEYTKTNQIIPTKLKRKQFEKSS
jgi:hypothetical protein